MTKRLVRLGHCHRCVYTWRMRRRSPERCPRCKSRLWRVPQIRPVKLGRGIGMEELLLPYRDKILRLTYRHGASRVWVFGSVRRREATDSSDVDLLVTWRRPVSILDVARLKADLTDLLGRKVDVVTRGSLHWSLQPQVEAEKVPL